MKEEKKEVHGTDVLSFILGMAMGIFIILMIAMLYFADDIDIINTPRMGEIFCDQYGLDYDHREINNQIPTIYCRPTDKIKIVDNLIVQIPKPERSN